MLFQPVCVRSIPLAGRGQGVSRSLVKALGFSLIALLLTHRVSVDESLPFLTLRLSSLTRLSAHLERTRLE